MKRVLAVAKRELDSSFNSPMAYTVILGFLVFTAAWLYFVRGFFALNQADLRPYFSVMPIVLAFLAPALTMRSWAEERRLGTYELLLTMPFSEGELVAGKFLASLAIAAIALALTIPVPLSASMLGSFDTGVLVAQYPRHLPRGGRGPRHRAVGFLAREEPGQRLLGRCPRSPSPRPHGQSVVLPPHRGSGGGPS